MEKNIKNYKVKIHNINVEQNNNGGLIRLQLVNMEERVLINKMFFTSAKAIQQNLISMNFWFKNILNKELELTNTDNLNFIKELEGEDALKEVLSNSLNKAIEMFNEIKEKELEFDIHKEVVEFTNSLGIKQTGVNINPWKFEETSTVETDFNGFL